MNRLAAETSPYLRQHRDNPVDWYAWGPEAFEQARRIDRPVLLSIGYSACHWCHVMAHECFEDPEVAAAMNEGFVNVKVDREERPDVDAVYMDAVQAMTGRGGWPMTVFLTPAGEPFYGGTYFPKPQFLELLAAIDDVWVNQPADVAHNVTGMLEAITRSARLLPAAEPAGIDALHRLFQQLGETYDNDWGGFGTAPKFPMTMALDLILRNHLDTGNPEAGLAVANTLVAMASGGIYDHLGGGFARYSVDEKWLVPHFEKMLYDQAMFARVYTHAARTFTDPHLRAVFEQVASETINYALTVLGQPGGGFSSAEDADSLDATGHSEEGAFYTWTVAEMTDALDGTDLTTIHEVLDYYELTHPANVDGNFEGRTIPARLYHRTDLLRPPAIEAARVRLFAARSQRPRPGLDDKVLTEWNALMLATLAEAASLFGRADWLAAAETNGEFLWTELRTPDGRWRRSWQVDGEPQARHSALAADHAALVDAFTRLAEATGEARWIHRACDVADTMLDHFWDTDNGGLFTTADDAEQLVVRQKDLLDNATPSANSMAIVALDRLAALTGEMRYRNLAEQILLLIGGLMDNTPSGFTYAFWAVQSRLHGSTEVAVVGDRPDLVAAVFEQWRPGAVLAWGEPYPSPLWEGRRDGFAYVCRDFTCQQPAATADELRAQLELTEPDAPTG
jgi:hypothetical protein